MKTHRLLCLGAALAALLIARSASADQAAFSVKAKALAGLLGYWSFEGNYEDQTGKGNHGKASGNLSLIKFCPGVKGGQGVQFDNATETGQFISVKAPIGGAFDSPTLSVFIWANVTSTAEADHWDNLLDRTSLWYLETQWQELADGSLKIDSVNRIYDPVEIQTAGSGQVRSSAASPPVHVGGNEWHLYGFTYDGKVMISYLDGKEIIRKEYATGVGPTAETPKEADSRHGHYDLNWGAFTQSEDYTNGCMDDTVIYNRALTADEVKSLFDAMMQ
jgi:hypothetical protein